MVVLEIAQDAAMDNWAAVAANRAFVVVHLVTPGLETRPSGCYVAHHIDVAHIPVSNGLYLSSHLADDLA